MGLLRIFALALGLIFAGIAAFGIPRREITGRRRYLVAISGLLLVGYGAIGSYAPRMALTRAWLILTGGLVDVGGYRLRIECFGAGVPTVVMDAGLAQGRSSWGQVPAGIAQFSRVCIYDRAGLGESDVGPRPRTSQQIVNELDLLLRHADIRAPFLLVGHSFGGANVRLYASEHPESVKGIVLIDAIQEDEIDEYAALLSGENRAKYLNEQRGSNYEGVNIEASLQQVKSSPLPSSLLLTVISAGDNSNYATQAEFQIHNKGQSALSQLIPNSKLIIVSKS